MSPDERTRNGQCVAKVLARSWDPSPLSVESPTSLTPSLTALLMASGAAALAWRKIARLSPSDYPTGRELHEAYRLHTIQAAVHELSLREAIGVLRANGIEPILVKGWAIARLYPEPGLRPYGDLDLCVDPTEYQRAREIVDSARADSCIDLHQGISELTDYTWEQVFARSLLVDLDGESIRVPCPEDHLRILCLHFLGHGAMRPLWLCDIAAALESRAANFDWDLFLGSHRRRADWIACILRLAHELLDMSLEGVPPAVRSQPFPKWLLSAVLKEWGTPLGTRAAGPALPMSFYLREPWGVFRGLQERWPNAIQATVEFGAPFNEFPRLPVQLALYLWRAARPLRPALH
jgi:hypothetical protein